MPRFDIEGVIAGTELDMFRYVEAFVILAIGRLGDDREDLFYTMPYPKPYLTGASRREDYGNVGQGTSAHVDG